MTDRSVRPPRASRRPYLSWVVACVAAEAVGMGAAATAARLGEDRTAGAALALVVAGGLVEGLALGGLQALVLGRLFPQLRGAVYVAATVLVAGLGWAVASAPGVLGGGDDSEGSTPMLALVLVGAAALGAVMGLALGTAQAVALRGAVRHPRRWMGANAAAWAPAMMVIFLGATTPGPSWPDWAVVVLGVVTGCVAGAVLGVVTGWFLPTLDGPPASSRLVLTALGTARFRRLGGAVVGLEVAGRRTGRLYRFPVQYAETPAGLAVMPAHSERKTWWRNLASGATPVAVLHDGTWRSATARAVRPGEAGYDEAVAAYVERWPRTAMGSDQLMVLVGIGSGPQTTWDAGSRSVSEAAPVGSRPKSTSSATIPETQRKKRLA